MDYISDFKLKSLNFKVDQEKEQYIFDLHEKFNKKFSLDEQGKLAFSQKVNFVYNTVALEGNTYTYAETETLLSGVTIGGHALKEEQEILNQKDAWVYTLEKAISLKDGSVITEDLIKDIHYRVGRETVVKPGQYRDGIVKIGGTNYQPPRTRAEIEFLVKNLLTDLDELQVNNYLKAFLLHFSIARIQPFFDGNKRTARLLMSYFLLANNYPILSVPVKLRKEYIDGMLNGYENLDVGEVVLFLEDLLIERLEGIV